MFDAPLLGNDRCHGNRIMADMSGTWKLAAIEKIAPPKNRKSLQRILGLINFWRKFVPQFSQNTYHMRKLLAKDVAFVWSSQCEKELQYLKTCLTSDPILQPINTQKT